MSSGPEIQSNTSARFGTRVVFVLLVCAAVLAAIACIKDYAEPEQIEMALGGVTRTGP